VPKADPMHGSTRLFYRPLPHVAAARERANLGVRHYCIDCVSHAAAVMIPSQLQGPRSCVLCLFIILMHQIQHSPLSHPTCSNQAIKQSINIQSINHAPFTIAAAASPRLLRPHWWLWRERRRWKRDDLLAVRLAPHAIQSLITTRTSNCDYSFLSYTSPIPYTSLRQQPRPCATSLEQTRLTRLRRRQLRCNVVSRPSCANREPTPSTCMLRYLSSLCYHSTRHYLPCRLVSR
jgi:hypothetical protein